MNGTANPGRHRLRSTRANDLPFAVGLSCPTTKECVAATFDGYAYTWDGASCSSPTLLDSTPGQGDITSLACAAPDVCFATGDAGNVNDYDGTWQQPTLVDDGHDLVSISCSPQAASAWQRTILAMCSRLTARAGPCRAAGPAIGSLDGVSCPSHSFCMAVDATGHELTWDGEHWSAPVTFDPHGITGPVSCPSNTFCVATDAQGEALVWAGNAWSRPVELAPALYSPAPAISCASATFCALVAAGDAFIWDGTTGPPATTWACRTICKVSHARALRHVPPSTSSAAPQAGTARLGASTPLLTMDETLKPFHVRP